MTKVSMYRKAICSILAVLLLSNLSGCMLLPKEEEERSVVFVKEDTLQQYAFISPVRMDLEKSLDIACVYRQLEEENLSFKLDGLLVEEVYVASGQNVKKGTLLATLLIENLEEELKSIEDAILKSKQEIEKLKLEAETQKSYVELDYKYKNISKAERDLKVSEIETSLKASLKNSEDQIYIQNLRLKELQDISSGSKIYAPMDGVISYVKEQLKNSLSEENIAVIKMINPSKCAFEIYKSEESAYLKEGQSYEVDCNGVLYEGTIMPSKESDSYIYLQMKDISQNLTVGAQGNIHYLADSRKNALVLPANTIHEGEGFKFVYILNESNIKAIKKVEVGLQTTEYVEIISGLEDNDLVINE